MTVERALADVTDWHVGGIIIVRGRGKYRVIEIGMADPARAGKLVDRGDGTVVYHTAGATITLQDLAREHRGGRQSRHSAAIFNQSEEDAENKIKKSSADGAPPDGVVAI